jgi:HlyD family secretion protein
MSVRRILATMVASLAILAAAYAYQTFVVPVPVSTQTRFDARSSAAPKVVSTEGVVMPARTVALSFKISGRVAQVQVAAGAQVKRGDVLARLDDSIWQKQVAQAQSAVALAQKELAQLQAGATPDQLAAAQAAVDAANQKYDRVKQGPTADQLLQLKAKLDDAQAALAQAQSAYDRVGGATNPNIGQSPEAQQLQQATNAYNAALGAYNDALSHPTTAELAAAFSQVQQAQEALATLTPTQAAIDVAQAQVDEAQAALNLAQAQAADYVLVAPFDGTIGEKDIEVGQVVQPGATVLVLGDLSKIQIETTDLTKADAPKVQVGAAANVTSDNFPGKTFRGTVTQIAPLALEHGRDTVYQVTIDLARADESELEWGMTTNVEIIVNQ